MTGQSSAALHRHRPGLQLSEFTLNVSLWRSRRWCCWCWWWWWWWCWGYPHFHTLSLLKHVVYTTDVHLRQCNQYIIIIFLIFVYHSSIKKSRLICSKVYKWVSGLLVNNVTCLHGAHLSVSEQNEWINTHWVPCERKPVVPIPPVSTSLACLLRASCFHGFHSYNEQMNDLSIVCKGVSGIVWVTLIGFRLESNGLRSIWGGPCKNRSMQNYAVKHRWHNVFQVFWEACTCAENLVVR